MADTLFWHNSEVLRVIPPEGPGESARVVLSAGAVKRRPEGASGIHTGTPGYLKPLELVFEQARLTGQLDACLGSITQGELRLASMRTQSVQKIPLPWQCCEPMTLTLTFRLGGVLVIEAAAAACTPTADTRFLESFAC